MNSYFFVHLFIMKNLTFLIAAVLFSGFFASCKKTDSAPAAPDPCLTTVINPLANLTHTITGQSLGTITLTAPIGSDYMYSIGGTTYQPSTNFFNLTAGTYTLTAKNTAGCSGKITLKINGLGAKFYAVRTLVNGYCGPCHLNGSVSGSKNFDDDNSILSSWERIKIRTVDGSPTFMPQVGQLTALDKQKIVDWVNAGHKITD